MSSTSPIEIVLIVVVLVAGLALLSRMTRSFVLPVVLIVVTSAAVAFLRPSASASPPPERPRSGTLPAYVGSNACRACHPSEHASFTRTFHRTMTQDATPKTVLAPL